MTDAMKVKPGSLGADWPIAAGFCIIKRPGIILLPLNGMQVHRRPLPRNLLGFPNNPLVPFILLSGGRDYESKGDENAKLICPNLKLIKGAS